MTPRDPLNRPPMNQPVSVETKTGETVTGTYRGWLRRDDVIVHRVEDGRGRREVEDREIRSVVA